MLLSNKRQKPTIPTPGPTTSSRKNTLTLSFIKGAVKCSVIVLPNRVGAFAKNIHPNVSYNDKGKDKKGLRTGTKSITFASWLSGSRPT